MGYTHYFSQLKDCTPEQWAKITAAFCKAFRNGGAMIQSEYDAPGTLPEVNSEHVSFNGNGDDGHETMCVHRTQQPIPDWQTDKANGTFAFCKTAAKPYDQYVVCLLVLMHNYAPGVWRISSDGGAEEWQLGKAMAEIAAAARFKCPIPKRRKS